MIDELPPLPIPDKQGCEDDPMYGILPVDYYTAEQMQAYARAAIERQSAPAGSLALDAAIGYIERHTPHLVYSEIKAALAAAPQPQPVQQDAENAVLDRMAKYVSTITQSEIDDADGDRGITSPQAQAAHGITKGTT